MGGPAKGYSRKSETRNKESEAEIGNQELENRNRNQANRGKSARQSRLASRFTILEVILQMLVYTLDGLEELMHSRGLASHFVCGQVGGYGVIELSGAAELP